MSEFDGNQTPKRRTRLIAFSVLTVLTAVGLVLSVINKNPHAPTAGPAGIVFGAVLFAASALLLTQTARGAFDGSQQKSQQALSLERRSGFFSRIASGVVAIVIGLVLMLKGQLAADLPWIGVAFVLAGLAVIALAFRYAHQRKS